MFRNLFFFNVLFIYLLRILQFYLLFWNLTSSQKKANTINMPNEKGKYLLLLSHVCEKSVRGRSPMICISIEWWLSTDQMQLKNVLISVYRMDRSAQCRLVLILQLITQIWKQIFQKLDLKDLGILWVVILFSPQTNVNIPEFL